VHTPPPLCSRCDASLCSRCGAYVCVCLRVYVLLCVIRQESWVASCDWLVCVCVCPGCRCACCGTSMPPPSAPSAELLVCPRGTPTFRVTCIHKLASIYTHIHTHIYIDIRSRKREKERERTREKEKNRKTDKKRKRLSRESLLFYSTFSLICALGLCRLSALEVFLDFYTHT